MFNHSLRLPHFYSTCYYARLQRGAGGGRGAHSVRIFTKVVMHTPYIPYLSAVPPPLTLAQLCCLH